MAQINPGPGTPGGGNTGGQPTGDGGGGTTSSQKPKHKGSAGGSAWGNIFKGLLCIAIAVFVVFMAVFLWWVLAPTQMTDPCPAIQLSATNTQVSFAFHPESRGCVYVYIDNPPPGSPVSLEPYLIWYGGNLRVELKTRSAHTLSGGPGRNEFVGKTTQEWNAEGIGINDFTYPVGFFLMWDENDKPDRATNGIVGVVVK